MYRIHNKNIEPTSVNTDMIGCVDGRPAIFVLSFNERKEKYEILLDTNQLKSKNYVEVLGAALGFIAIAEVKLGLNMVQAFNLVEKALISAGYQPTFHADTHYGNHQDLTSELQRLYEAGKKVELIDLVLQYLDGCGFAVYQWGKEKAKQYIAYAVQRGWLIQVLTGNHEESKGGAHLNFVPGKSLSVVEANAKQSPQFTQDMWFIGQILKEMQKRAKRDRIKVKPDFETDSLNWFTETFAAVVVALGGVSNASQIQEHRK